MLIRVFDGIGHDGAVAVGPHGNVDHAGPGINGLDDPFG